MIGSVSQLVEVAVAAARAGGGRLLEMDRGGLAVERKSSASDYVTAADYSAEAVVRRTLAERRPGDGVLGEEGGTNLGSSGFTWIVDPLDGTTNFLRGIAYWATSVAVRHDDDGTVLAGAVYAPELGRLYSAGLGAGAQLGRGEGHAEPLRATAEPARGEALIGTGFAYDPAIREAQVRALPDLLAHAADLRRLGAASLDLCAVADGSIDAFLESGLELYDYAAGALIAAEAGARVTGLGADAPPDSALVLAASPDLHATLLTTLRGHAAHDL